MSLTVETYPGLALVARDPQAGLVHAAYLNAASDVLEALAAHCSGARYCWSAGDLIGLPVTGQLWLSLSAGRVTVAPGITLRTDTPYLVTGLPANAVSTVYAHADGSVTLAAGADGFPLCRVSTNGTQATAVDNLPAGRVNFTDLLHVLASGTDRQGGTLSDKLATLPGLGSRLRGSAAQTLALGLASAGHTDGGAPNLPFLPEHDHFVAIAADTHYYGPPCLLLLPDGRLLCLYRKGTTNGSDIGVAAAKWSSDLGATWSAEVTFPHLTDGTTCKDLQEWDAVLLPTGTLLPNGSTAVVDTLVAVLYVYDLVSLHQLWSCTSTDYGATWSPPAQIALPGYTGGAIGAPPILMPDGSILAPFYGSNVGVNWDAAYLRSSDGGSTWSAPLLIASGAGTSTQLFEPNLLFINDGTAHGKLLCFLRNGSDNQHIMLCSSADGGVTWTTPANVFGGTGSPRAILTGSGNVLVTCRNRSFPSVGGSELGATVRSSSDFGATWATDSQQVFADSDSAKLFAGAYASLAEILPGVLAWAYTKAVDSSQSAEACDLRLKYLFEKAGPFSAIGSAALLSLAVTGRLSLQGNAASLLIRDDLANLGARPPAPHPRAAAQIDSVTRGLLLSRLTTTQRDAQTGWPEGEMIYNTTLHKLQIRVASAWETVTSA